MGTQNPRIQARLKRKKRIKKKISGTPQRPRLCVFRSSKHIYAQVIDDLSGRTLAAASSIEPAFRKQADFENKIAAAAFVGQLVGKRLLDQGVQQVVFDRNGFLYHGRVKALSNGAREAGLIF